jgi:3'-phosphoadenosine 5'-phosphosulfate sulfotransferase (PAPS reductase)/FAD synthetase
MLLHAIHELNLEVIPVFADTGNEHEMTYEYINYLEREIGPIQRVKAEFSERIAHKRLYVSTKWREEGVSETIIEDALEVLQSTGNPFLDLCIWKGRFPSRMAQFCTAELKVRPVQQQVYIPLMDEGKHVVSLVGVRANESAIRATYPMWEDTPEGWQLYRPILDWDVRRVFKTHKKYGIDPNPLYKLGMGRVGCMPCINCQKDELYEISRRFPEVIERIRRWEEVVAMACKRGSASFFPWDDVAGQNIDEYVEWSKTVRGGRQYDILKMIDLEQTPMCSSVYGLCE